MRIAYGVQTTGNGHAARSRIVIRELKRRGHEVLTVLSGAKPWRMADDEDFQPCVVRNGMYFVATPGKLSTRRSIANFEPRRFLDELRELDLGKAELVITDYESLTAWAARRRGIPSIGLANQYSALEFSRVPRGLGSPLRNQVMRLSAPVDLPLGLHWHHFNLPLLPPICPRQEVVEGDPDCVLVYMPWEARDNVRRMLLPFAERTFLIYGCASVDEDEGHLKWRGFSKEGFNRDLRRCAGVICNASFETPSQALMLGRKLLVRPLQGQPEQEANASSLQQLGYARVMRKLEAEAVAAWLPLSSPLPMPWPNVASHFCDWLEGDPTQAPDDLAERCWAELQAERDRLLLSDHPFEKREEAPHSAQSHQS